MAIDIVLVGVTVLLVLVVGFLGLLRVAEILWGDEWIVAINAGINQKVAGINQKVKIIVTFLSH